MPHSGKALPLTLLLDPRLILTPLGRGAPRTWHGAHSCFAWARRPLVLCYGTGPTQAAPDLGPFILLGERHADSYLRLTSTSAHSGLTRVRPLPPKSFTWARGSLPLSWGMAPTQAVLGARCPSYVTRARCPVPRITRARGPLFRHLGIGVGASIAAPTHASLEHSALHTYPRQRAH